MSVGDSEVMDSRKESAKAEASSDEVELKISSIKTKASVCFSRKVL